jgi:N-acetylglutamate synthase-like GNAT family acetyltransferase
MNIIRIVEWASIKSSWDIWHEFKPTDPEPVKIDTSTVLVDLSCLRGYDQSRTFGFFHNDTLLGCGTVSEKVAPGLRIGGICDIAVYPLYRKNHIGNHIMSVCLAYMNNVGFDVSVLWASIPEMYRKHGYIEIYENMMYRPIKGLPGDWDITRLVNLPSQVGVW